MELNIERDKIWADLSDKLAARFVRFVKKMARKRRLKIYPSRGINNWIKKRIFSETDRRMKFNHLAYGMAALILDRRDDPKDDGDLVLICRVFVPDAEKFFDENGELFAEAVLESERR